MFNWHYSNSSILAIFFRKHVLNWDWYLSADKIIANRSTWRNYHVIQGLFQTIVISSLKRDSLKVLYTKTTSGVSSRRFQQNTWTSPLYRSHVSRQQSHQRTPINQVLRWLGKYRRQQQSCVSTWIYFEWMISYS